MESNFFPKMAEFMSVRTLTYHSNHSNWQNETKNVKMSTRDLKKSDQN